MTSLEALKRAETCARLASQIADPMKRTLLQQMRQAWVRLAVDALKPNKHLDAEGEMLADLEAALLRRPNVRLH
jgi:hypothetical protein